MFGGGSSLPLFRLFGFRVGVRGPMLAGAAAIFAAMALAWAVPRLEILFVASPLAGSGFFLFHIAAGQAAAVIGRPQDRVRNFGLLALAYSTSGFLGPVLAGFAIDGIGHRGAMLALSVAALATIIGLAARRADIPGHAAAAAAPHGERRIADLLRDAPIVEEARSHAKRMIDADPELSDPAFARLRKMVLARYGEALDLGAVG